MAQKHIEYPTSYNDNYTEQDQVHVRKIIDFMNASKSRTGRWLARAVDVSDAYISSLLNGAHPVEAGKLIYKILPVIEDSQRDNAPGEFVETSIFHMVRHACRMAKDSGMFSIVSGAPGVGKTKALKRFKELYPNSLYLCGSEVINSTAIIDMLLDELNVKATGKLRKSMKVDRIVDQLADTQRLIILDEADKCQVDTPDPLRTISDRTGCGVVLAGNIGLRDAVASGAGRYDLIESRVVFWPKPLLHVSLEDVSQLLRPYLRDDQIAESESFEEIARYAAQVVDGSARKLVRSLVPNIQMLIQQKEAKSDYKGIDRRMIAFIAKNFMGINHPPAIPHRTAAVPV
ncbi:AAA family ATPase [Bowmanella dokdonensis]|uniref:AAA family ATPase n=1 Tax=Bowmanella dokdonensis TaxID=751969 RepID=A0A939DMC5_9ALTE|nr:AAA family ATPase [Bowmanella dokdonensis]MBN7824755.1 AAA family ATPase [Bowmanella dokdonensis]